MKKTNLKKIYLRARDKEGKWGSFSIKELIEGGQAYIPFVWAMEKLCNYQEGAIISEENVQKLVDLLPKDSYVSLK